MNAVAVGPFVLINIQKKHNDVIMVNGKEMYIDPLYRPEWNLTISGIVEALPNVEPYDQDGNKITPILEVGDKVYFRHVYADSEIYRVASDYENPHKPATIRVPYADIFCRIVGGKIVPNADWILAEPCMLGEGEDEYIEQNGRKVKVRVKYLNKSLNLVESESTEYDKLRGVAKYVGKLPEVEQSISPGDLVFGKNICYQNVIEGEELYCFKQDTAQAIL